MGNKKRPPGFFGLFVCERTSTYGERPCDEAIKLSYVRVDRRTIDDPKKNPYIGRTWYKSGRNHRVEDGMIARDFDDERWMVEIADEQALQEFIQKYGTIIISPNSDGLNPVYEIEIYDTYRE